MRVMMYPAEYLTYAVDYAGAMEDVSRLIRRPDGSKQFRISDHLASLRATVDAGGITTYDYDPWGKPLEESIAGESRRTYNDRERDRESGNYNLGVRQYSDDEPRFSSIDPLWEKFRSRSPYAYANNNPLRFTDPDGMQAREVSREQQIANSVVTGFVLRGPQSILGAIVDNVKFMVCPVCEAAKDVQNLIDGTTVSRATALVERLSTDENALAEFGGMIGFNVVFARGIGLGAAFSGKGGGAGQAAGRSVAAEAEAAEAGIVTKNGIKIEGFTGHGINRAIGDGAQRQGVSPRGILDALKDPLHIKPVKVDDLGRSSQRFVGQQGSVVVNPESGKIISVNPVSSKKAATQHRRD